ncbi:hypothetical protein Tdes44962_MAKER02662 [Teratosphaeria destructans]|uniref:Uncharacterized protein n=1 Tax=Teratosphaeria destructans TaxID=418781 RepID=A0A9W7ST72_9PEZI|nr:hypothetical protein Tdes44962_MAKER02662 [Teratosphaeria destructans]
MSDNSIQESGPSWVTGAQAATSDVSDVNYLNDNDFYRDSQYRYQQDYQNAYDADNDFVMTNQEYAEEHLNSTVPPFAYDQAARHVTYRTDYEFSSGLNNTALPGDVTVGLDQQSSAASPMQDCDGVGQYEAGDASQQMMPNEDSPQHPCRDRVVYHACNDRIDNDHHSVVYNSRDPVFEDGTREVTPDQYDEGALSLVQEARDEGLCLDYLAEDPFRPYGLPTPPLTQIEDMPEAYLEAAVEVCHNLQTLEKWEVDREAAGFLADVMALGKDDGIEVLLRDSYPNFGDLRLVEPLLQRDPERELRNLKLDNAVSISTRGIIPFGLDIEKDEAIGWPEDASSLRSQKETEIRAEKLDIGRDVLLHVRELMDLPTFNLREIFDLLLDQGKRRHAVKYMSPPLLPLSQPYSPPRLPGSVQQMPLTSSPEDLIARDLANVSQSIKQMDVAPHPDLDGSMEDLNQGTIDPRLLYSGLESLEDTSSTPNPREKLSQLEVDVPLLAQSSTGTDVSRESKDQPKAVPLPLEICSLLSEPDPDLSIFDSEFAEKDVQAYVDDELIPILEAINNSASNESLDEFDTTIRVPVPPLPANKPKVPWEVYSRADDVASELQAQRAFMAYTRRETLKGERHWSGVSKLERALHWTPFPSRLGKVNLIEEIDDDKSAYRYMAGLGLEGEVDVDVFISGADGLRLLNPSDSDDEELEAADSDDGEEECGDVFTQPKLDPEPQRQMGSDMLQKYGPDQLMHVKLQSAPLLAPMNVTSDTVMQLERTLPLKAHMNVLPKATEPARPSMSALLLKRKLELEQNSQQDAGTSDGADRREAKRHFKPSRVSDLFERGGLVGFLGLQGIRADNVVQPIHQQREPVKPLAPAAIMVAPAVSAQSVAPRQPLPSPAVVEPTRPMRIVVSTQMIANRALVRGLQTMLPNLDMIERDAISAAACSEKDVKASVNADADITLSPASGLVTTTLQKLKQRRLPGQTAFFGVRERISIVAMRYERLTVLINEGGQPGYEGQSSLNALDQRDCDALVDFMAFTYNLDSDINVSYVPGGEGELVQWIAASVSQSATTSNHDLKLLPDETLWERFLRAAGMNAYAAQAILDQLKRSPVYPDASDASIIPSRSVQEAESGLAAFVRMSAEGRVRQFGQMLGGERVLSRVAKAIDGPWMSTEVRREI